MTPQTEQDLLAAIGRRQAVQTAAGKHPGSLIVDGDSWCKYPPWAAGGNIATKLEERWENVFNIAGNGHRLESIAFDRDQYDEIARAMQKLKDNGPHPVAVVLSAAGNDFMPSLGIILEHAQDHGAPDRINMEILEGLFTRLSRALKRTVELYDFLAQHYYGHTLPVVVHGYDTPWPDGRGFLSGIGPLPGPWIQPEFQSRGYDKDDVDGNRLIVAECLHYWNETLIETVAEVPSLHYVDLRNTLTSKDEWADEMHPDGGGMELLAQRIDARLMEVIG